MIPSYNEGSNKNYIFTDSDNDEYIKKNYDTEKIANKNINKIDLRTNLNNINSKNITYNKSKKKNNSNSLNNNFDNTIPRSKKNHRLEIQSIENLLRYFKEINNYNNINNFNNNNNNSLKYNCYLGNNTNINMNSFNISIEELENKKKNLNQKLNKLRQKNKELSSYLGSYKPSMTNEDMEHEQRLQYIKYLEDKRKDYILCNNKLKYELKNKGVSLKKKIENLINKQIKEYENIYMNLELIDVNNNDLGVNMVMNNDYSGYKNTYKKDTINDNDNGEGELDDEIRNNGNIYTNNNLPLAKCELSLGGGGNTDYKLNNTTDGLINSKPKVTNNTNMKNNINNTSIKFGNNNIGGGGGEEKNKNNNIANNNTTNTNNNINNYNNSYKNNTSKKNHPSSIKFIKSTKITRNNNASSILSSHDNNKKSEFKNLKQITKLTSGLSFGIK